MLEAHWGQAGKPRRQNVLLIGQLRQASEHSRIGSLARAPRSPTSSRATDHYIAGTTWQVAAPTAERDYDDTRRMRSRHSSGMQPTQEVRGSTHRSRIADWGRP